MIFNGDKRRRVGLFGGSFNPPHVGHTKICQWVFAKGLVDELWVIPCFIHPFGKELLPFEHRFAMCDLAFTKLSMPIFISDIERKLGGVSYTVRTIEHFKKQNPDERFFLISGDDVHDDSKKWHDFARIKDLVDIIRIPRGENSPIPFVSSTDVRKSLQDRNSFKELVEPEVAVYIITKGLFKDREALKLIRST